MIEQESDFLMREAENLLPSLEAMIDEVLSEHLDGEA